MTGFSNELENYILDHIDKEDPILTKLNRHTQMKVLYSQMCSGHIQGSVLTMLSKLIAPKNILEIGTFTGYSAICLSKGLQKGGKLHTIEINDELEEFTYQFLEEAELSDTVIQHIGNAEEIIPTMTETFDLIFMDANKRRYSEHFDLIIDKVKVGGVIIADNTLWYGKVAEKIEKMDDQTKGILNFNDKVVNDSRVETYMLPIRDGLTVLRKVSEE